MAAAGGREIDRWTRRLAWAAVLAAGLLAVTLALHRVADNDLGYHLAYGETWLRTGRIVDGGRFLYTDFDPAELARPGNRPPGGWYDQIRGELRFPNANYLSQAMMALAFRAGGFAGTILLQALLTGALMALLALFLRRRGVPPLWLAPALLLVVLGTYERASLRPELFGYVLLLAELVLLSAPSLDWRKVAALILCQGLFVQLHSYWLLGLGLAGAFLAEALFAEALLSTPLAREGRRQVSPADRRRLQHLAVALLGMAAVAFVNPWGWRMVAFPLETLLFLRTHAAPAAAAAGHPWAQVTECQGPFAALYLRSVTTYAFVAALALAALATMAALLRRNWAHLLILAGITLVGLSMRRNVAVAVLLLVPVAAATLRESWGAWQARRRESAGRRRGAIGQWAPLALGALALLIAAGGILEAATSRLYYRENRRRRAGIGPAERDLPFAAARVLRDWPAMGDGSGRGGPRLFCSYNTGSTLLFFAGRDGAPREVPIYSNQWAYPASLMAENFRLCSAEGDFMRFAVEHDVGAVLLDCTTEHAKLARRLLHQVGWRPLHFDGLHLLLARPDVPPPSGLAPFLDAEALIAEIRASEPFPAFALQRAGACLHLLELLDSAERFCRAAIENDARRAGAWQMLGVVLATRASRALQQDPRSSKGWSDLEEAARSLREGLRLDHRDAGARENLRRVEQMLAQAPRR